MSTETPKSVTPEAVGSNAEKPFPANDGKLRRRNKNRRGGPREGRFEGDCPALKGHTYDVIAGGDTFAKTTRKIAEYVARSYDDAGDFRTGMIDLDLPDIQAPPDPDVSKPLEFEMWKIARRTFEKKKEARERIQNRVFALLLGQCSQALRNRMEPHEDWHGINLTSDVIELLKLIQSCMSQKQTRKDPDHAVVDADIMLYRFTQNNLADNSYYEKFKDLVQTVESLGGEIGCQAERVFEHLKKTAADPNNPTPDETEAARLIAKDRYLAILFLVNSDRRRYGGLVRDITNQHTRGVNGYPDSLSAAYDYLVNYQGNRTGGLTDDGGLSFYTGDPENDHNRLRDTKKARTQPGKVKPGKTSGRNPQGTRTRGKQKEPGKKDQENQDAGQDSKRDSRRHAQFLLEEAESSDNLEDSDTSYLMLAIDTRNGSRNRQHCHQVQHNDGIDTRQLLLLDSCSTVCLISDESLLHNIHRTSRSMTVQCNAGTRTTRYMGWLGTFPEPVWFDPGGVANIMSLHIMKRYYDVKYDSATNDAFVVTTPKGQVMHFSPTHRGLYACTGNSNAWAFVNTVSAVKTKLSKRALKDAALARRVQNIIMYPGEQAYAKIVDHNLLPNCPVTRADIVTAAKLYGPNINALKGKTVKRSAMSVKGQIADVPPEILTEHQSVTLEIDIMFVNKMPFLITTSRKLRFGTVEHIANRQHPTIAHGITKVVNTYQRRGFRVTHILADPEFEPIKTALPAISFNLCAQDEHIPGIERYIRTVKDRARSGYNALPFQHLPRIMVSRLIGNAVFWLNAFPHPDGVSDTLSPRYLLTGKHLDYNKHVRLEFGAYAQTHEEHSNDMQRRTIGAICLGPSGNEQGGHYFMSLMTGQRLHRDRWTALPMPQDVIDRVSNMGRRQHMPKSLTFADRFGHELEDHHDSVDDDHDSDYIPDDEDDDSYCSDDTSSYPSSDHDDDSDGPNDPQPDHTLAQPLPGLSAGVTNTVAESTHGTPPINTEITGVTPHTTEDGAITAAVDTDNTETAGVDETQNAGMEAETTGVDETQTAGVDEMQSDEEVGDINDMAEGSEPVDMDNRYGPRNHDHNLRPRRRRDYTHRYGSDEETMMSTIEHPLGLAFMTEQMSVKKGLKTFGEAGANAVVEEMQQLEYRDVLEPVKTSELSHSQRKRALRYLMYLKQKRCGRIKARGCADGRKQRVYKTKDETSSPTVSTEALFLTAAIDAKEGRKVVTVDIPGAFMHADMNEEVHMKLEGKMAELLCRVDPKKYKHYMTKEKGKPVVYVRLKKALYGTLQAALLFWQNLSTFLIEELGFVMNPYDKCVVNKMIDDTQCTIVWHVDDLKMSHMSESALMWVVDRLNDKYGKEAPVTVHRGAVHEYLGMKIDYSVAGQVTFRMDDYLQSILHEVPNDMLGTAITPATNRLFEVNPSSEKLTDAKADKFHHLAAKLLYLCKRGRPDIQTAVSFLCTRVQQPDTDDWKKLCRCVRYLRGSDDMWLTLHMHDEVNIQWWIDASFGVHPDLRSHTGATMSLGLGSAYSFSRKQKLNTRSSTEAELVGVDDAMSLVLWTRLFLLEQGLQVEDNVIYQDNQSAMRLEGNGRSSCGKQTRHLNMRYFFITSRINAGHVRVQYCPTQDMIGDFFTKPLQGAQFRRLRQLILNLPNHEPDAIDRQCMATPQECVDKRTYADAVRGPHSGQKSAGMSLSYNPRT